VFAVFRLAVLVLGLVVNRLFIKGLGHLVVGNVDCEWKTCFLDKFNKVASMLSKDDDIVDKSFFNNVIGLKSCFMHVHDFFDLHLSNLGDDTSGFSTLGIDGSNLLKG